jgi:hypothetical protein
MLRWAANLNGSLRYVRLRNGAKASLRLEEPLQITGKTSVSYQN